MKLSVYVPKDLQQSLIRRARGDGLSPSRFVQELIRKCLRAEERRFSDEFFALAGSWEDDRTAEALCRDIEASRVNPDRTRLL